MTHQHGSWYISQSQHLKSSQQKWTGQATLSFPKRNSCSRAFSPRYFLNALLLQKFPIAPPTRLGTRDVFVLSTQLGRSWCEHLQRKPTLETSQKHNPKGRIKASAMTVGNISFLHFSLHFFIVESIEHFAPF